MAIKFNCPHCKKALSVKDDSLAGKKAACTGCKKIVVIPKPAAAVPDEDMEALAMAALAEPKPDPATVPESATIEFECPQCGEQVKMAREFIGKNAPCPECRRIIRVPMPKTKDPADWRQTDTLPAGARRDTEPAPEGAWEPSRAKGVSVEALTEAGVIKKKKKPGLTRRQKIIRILIGSAVGIVVLVGGFFTWSALAHTKQDTVVAKAAEAAEKSPSKEAAAEASRAAGEYFLRTGTRDAADKAQQRFAKARDLLEKSPAGPGRDAMLADLLVSQTGLGGNDAEAARGTRLKWGPTLDELKKTLSHVTTAAGRLNATRLVGRKLIARDRAEDAAKLAGQAGGNKGSDADAEALYEGPESLAVLGIELFRAGQKDLAGKLADRAARVYAPQPGGAAAQRPPLAPSVVALCVALDKPVPKPGDGKQANDDKELFLVGQAAGLALKGDAAEARKVNADKPEGRLQVLTALAEATGDPADVDAATGVLDGELNGKPVSPWLVYRLARAAAEKPGGADRALKLAEQISDPALKVVAQLLAVRARLDGTKDRAGDGVLEGIDGGPLAQSVGRELLARHNARLDGGTAKAAEGWEESVRPFGVLGAALGGQDGR